MLTAIDFDNHTTPQARKVEYVSIARHLAPEMKAIGAQGAQVKPQLDLLPRHGFAQLACARVRHQFTPPGRPAASHPPLAGEGWSPLHRSASLRKLDIMLATVTASSSHPREHGASWDPGEGTAVIALITHPSPNGGGMGD